MENAQKDTVRVLVPHDIGFADGGCGPLGFPFNFLLAILTGLYVLLTPWSWKWRIHRRFIFPIMERRRIARGEAPSGHHYAEYPADMTLDELIEKLGYDSQFLKSWDGEFGDGQRKFGPQPLRDIPPTVVTELIRGSHMSHW